MITVILYLAIGLWYVFVLRKEAYVDICSYILDLYRMYDECIRKIFIRIMLIIYVILWPILLVEICWIFICNKIHH